MSAISSFADGVFGIDAPRANVPDYAASADPAQPEANTMAEAEAAARRARRRSIESYIIPVNNSPMSGSGLYIP